MQAAFRRSDALFRGFVGGIGSGKSWVGAYDLIRRSKRGRTYMVIGPTYTSLQDSSLKTFLRLGREFGVIDPANTRLSAPPQLTLSTGADVLFRSADRPDSLRGPNLSGVWMDEGSLSPELAYDVALGRLREGGEQGWLSVTFTPKGPTHWTHERFNTGRPDTAVFKASTRANPFNPAGFADKLRQQYGDTLFAKQELDGDFVSLEGSEFPPEWFQGEDLWFDAWPETGVVLKVISLDPSKGTDGKGVDYQAHVLVSVVIENDRYVFYLDADLRREGVVPMCERTVSLYREFSRGRMVDSVVAEENGTMGLLPPALDTAATKANVYLPYLLRTNIDKKEFRIRYQVAPPLSRRQLRFRRTPGGRMLAGQLREFPLGEFDDAPDALATGLKRVAEMLGGGQ